MDQLSELDKHKWIESEKAQHDLGQTCICDWINTHAAKFREQWESEHGKINDGNNCECCSGRIP